MKNRASKVDKMNFIEPVMISFVEDTSFKMTDQIDDFVRALSPKKTVNLPLCSGRF